MKFFNCTKPLLLVSIPALLLSCSKSKTDIQSTTESSSAEEQVASTLFDTSSLSIGLVAYYPFKKNLLDASGNGHDGTKVGTITYVTNHKGKPKSAALLGSGRITTDNFFQFQYADSFSVSMWFTTSTSGSNGRILSTECPEGNFRVASFGSGVYAWSFGSASYYIYDTVALNTWNQVVYTFNKGKVKLYKNGVLKYSGINASTEPLNYCAPFTIGAKASASYDMWQGSIESLRVYSRTLSNAEVRYLATH